MDRRKKSQRKTGSTIGRPPARTRGRGRRTLILCVDRDDDLGRKTDTPGPLVGPEAIEAAARALSLADPEDSDTNTLWATLRHHSQAVEQAGPGEHYDVACVTGDRVVGTKSDQAIVTQFEGLVDELAPDRLVVVTDGAEDEHVLPLLESRIPIDAVHRVVVKQSRNLEGAYYLLVRLFEDDRMRKRFILPTSLGIIVFGIAFALGHVALAVGGLLFTLGLFLLIHAMGWETTLGRVARDFYEGLSSGKMSFFTSILAIALIAFGVLRAYTDLHRTPDLSDATIRAAQGDPLLMFLLAPAMTLWWIVGGLALNILGRAVDDLFRTQSTRGLYWRLLFGLPAVGLILQGLLHAAITWRTGTPLPAPLLEPAAYTPVTVGFVLAVVGNYTFRYVRDTMREDEGPPPPGSGGRGGPRQATEERIRMPGRPRDTRRRSGHTTAPAPGHEQGP